MKSLEKHVTEPYILIILTEDIWDEIFTYLLFGLRGSISVDESDSKNMVVSDYCVTEDKNKIKDYFIIGRNKIYFAYT